MAYTHYYVSAADGNDSYDGTSPTYVSGSVGPKATIQAGLNLIPNANGEYQVNVKPGVYHESNIIPPYAGGGTGSLMNKLVGDFDGSIWGVNGYVIVNGTDANYEYNSATVFSSTGNKWQYWSLQNLFSYGSWCIFEIGTPGSTAMYYRELINCIGLANAYAVRCSNGNPADREVFWAKNCKFFGGTSAFMVGAEGATSGHSNWNYNFQNCDLFSWANGNYGPIYIGPYNTATVVHTRILDCNVVNFLDNASKIARFDNGNSAALKLIRCALSAGSVLSYGSYASLVYEDCYKFGTNSPPSGVTKLNNFPFIPVGYHINDADLINLLSYTGISAPIPADDLYGRSRPTSGTNNWTPGSEQEAFDLKPPVGKPSGGGGGSVFGGTIVRAR